MSNTKTPSSPQIPLSHDLESNKCSRCRLSSIRRRFHKRKPDSIHDHLERILLTPAALLWQLRPATTSPSDLNLNPSHLKLERLRGTPSPNLLKASPGHDLSSNRPSTAPVVEVRSTGSYGRCGTRTQNPEGRWPSPANPLDRYAA